MGPESPSRYSTEHAKHARKEQRAWTREMFMTLWWASVRSKDGSLQPGYADPREREHSLSDILEKYKEELAPYTQGDNIVFPDFGLAFEKWRGGQYRGRLKTPREYLPQTAGEDYTGGDVPGSWIPEDASKFFLLSALRAQKGEIPRFELINKEITYMVLKTLELANMDEVKAVSQAVEEVLEKSAEEAKSDEEAPSSAAEAPANGEEESAKRAISEQKVSAIKRLFQSALHRAGAIGEKVVERIDVPWHRIAEIIAFGLLLKAGLPHIEVTNAFSPRSQSAVSRIKPPDQNEPSIQLEGLREPTMYTIQKGGTDSLWNIAKNKIVPQFYPTADAMHIQIVAEALAKDNGIAVPEWGIDGDRSHKQLREGEKIVVGDHTKAALSAFGPGASARVDTLYP